MLTFARKNLGFSPDPKLHFRATTLAQLHSSTHPIPASDVLYWSNYWTLFDHPSDVTTLISLSDLRKAIRLQPENIITLIQLLICKLDHLVHSESIRKTLADRETADDRPSSDPISHRNQSNHNNNNNNSTFTNQLKDFSQKVPSTLLNGAADLVGVGGGSKSSQKGPSREILNCVRVLTRILPLLIEEASSGNNDTHTPISAHPGNTTTTTTTTKSTNDKTYWINNLLWGTVELESSTKEEDTHLAPATNPLNQAAPQFVLDEDDEDEQDSSETGKLVQETKPIHPSHPTKPTSPRHNNSQQNRTAPSATKPPLLVTLIHTILDLLFLPGVCVPVLPNQSASSRYPIWTGGIGSSQMPSDHTQAHNSAKVEVLRLLLAVLSKPLFSAPHLYTTGGGSIHNILGCSSDPLDPFRATLSFPNPALTYLCTKTSRPLLLALLCSLINTALVPTRNNFSSPASALNTLANGLGRITQGKMGLGTSPAVDSTPTEPSSTSPVSSSAPRRPSLTPQNSSTAHYGGASTAGIPQDLPGWCAVVLSVLLLPDPANSPESPTGSGGREDAKDIASDPSKQVETNGFRMYLSKVHRPADLSFLVDHLLVILMKPMKVTSQLLSSDSLVGSSALIGGSFLNYGCGLSEAMLILHLALDSNPRLVSHLIATGKIASLMIALTFICLEQKDSPKPKTGLVKLCAITLQLLTAHDRKELSHIVNSKVDLPVGIRAQYSVPGTLTDFLIVSICSVIFSTSSQLATPSTPTHNAAHNNPQDADNGVDANFNTIYTPLVLALTNLSPFLKDLTPAASSRLSQLFLFFSSPGFLLREDGNVKLLYYVLEIFNNIIHYQMPDNPHLIYSIIKVHQRFESLATFTLKKGLKEIERVKQRRQSMLSVGQGERGRDSSAGDARRGSVRGSSIAEEEESKIFDADEHEVNGSSAERKPLADKGKGRMRDPMGPSQQASGSGVAPPPASSSSYDQFQLVGSRQSSSSFDHASAPPSDSWTHINQPPVSPLDPDPVAKLSTPQAVGRNGFVPSESWVASWRDSLPLDAIQIMLSELKPKVVREEGSAVVDAKPSAQALNLLRSATLIGMLPVPNKRWKRARKFELKNGGGGGGGLNWMGSFLWSLVFIKDSNSMAGTYLAGSASSSNPGGNSHGAPTDGGALRIRLFGVMFLPRRSSSGIVRDLLKPFASAQPSLPSLPASRSSSLSDLASHRSSSRDRHTSH
ncbi:hypothetical protein PCASD_10634 [Puccinia coronata f. sp. avenae]|uniref:Uncharacterized protein n=1 Tax=Puccinia coronata f. sp. avenae TaxID=200324 RepID=A0A2N5TEI1_9BASI|nr:hypothetical protein PCASD_10634 [Puccinia coronata f. sp. avenae]